MAESSCGELLVERIIRDMAEHGIEPDQRDRELFDVIAALRDEIEELTGIVEAEGRTVVLKDGRIAVHGGVTEIRLQRSYLAKLLAQMDVSGTQKNPVKQKAAMARWAQHNAAKAAMYDEGA